MKRKLTSAVLAIALTLSLSVPAFAADRQNETDPDCPDVLVWQWIKRCCGSGQADVEALLRELFAQWFAGLPDESATPEAPSEPAQPAQPAQPTQPTQPPEPTQPAQPTPTQPAEPQKPAEPSAGDFMSTYEQEVVRLVNAERAKQGLAALTADASLTRTARMKSQDMRDKRYFDHNSPTYGSPFDLMKSQGIRYRTAGENIAMGYATPQAVVSAWMASPGHRANILNPSYTKIGVGYVASGNYWTQHFTG